MWNSNTISRFVKFPISSLNLDRGVVGTGINETMVARVGILAKAVSLEKDVCMTGGVAKNEGMFPALEEVLGVKLLRMKTNPQIAGALGAALIARGKAAAKG